MKSYLIGDKYGSLTIIKGLLFNSKNRKISMVVCRCDCGNKINTTITKLRSGHTVSCKKSGCRFGVHFKHGMSNSPTYNAWSSMLSRCANKNNPRYSSYGGRGIRCCKEWYKFSTFLKDMGIKPPNMSLDRIDNNGNYCKENCKWSTSKEQSNNTRRTIFIEYNGERKTISDWSMETGISYKVLSTRIYRGWSVERALNINNKK